MFTSLAHSTDVVFNPSQNLTASIKVCPNTSCTALVFVVYQFNNRAESVYIAYPPERLDFDVTGIPESVSKALEEAITCHANQAYVAAAIMVRKTLEELCHDQKAEGANLYKRLENLGTKIVVPKGLIEAAHDLRLLGNDAAHIEAKTYNQVSKDEVEVGIMLAQELLKAVFQYDTLFSKLRDLKKKGG